MGLTIGARFAQYEILAPLGAGGMGEVYRARDTRLNREVAIKVLPDLFASDPERLARFEREAQVLASLNHPNIAHIHGLEEANGARALVMELVEGEDLAQRIARGPISLDEALPIARQIAEALEAAHEQGIIHRDLKPPNIKFKNDGTVKVLDFGLAKALDQASDIGPQVSDAMNSPTITTPGMTAQGIILGTAGYMAPEQAKGRRVDKRADVWAFGAVLFEVLSGKRAFPGESPFEILGAVLKIEPDWSLLPATTPTHIRQLLRLCLEKEPKQRLQVIGDAKLLLDTPVDAPVVAIPSTQRSKLWITWAGAGAILTVLAVVGWLRPRESNQAATPSLTVTIAPPSDSAIVSVGTLVSTPNISPDGAFVVYRSGGGLAMYRKLSSLEPVRLSATVGIGNDDFWSPDSKSLAFTTSGDLKKMRLPDGATEVIAQGVGPTRGGTWSENGTILFSQGGLFVTPDTGGTPKIIEVPGLTDGSFYYPEFLTGEDFLFGFVRRGSEQVEVYLAKLREGKADEPVMLFKNETTARYTPAGGGHILFVRGDNLYAQKLDVRNRKLTGEPELVQQGIASAPAFYRAHFSVSGSGVVAWRPGKAAVAQVTIFDRQGKELGTAGAPASVMFLRLSPDETHLLAGSASNESWLSELGRPGRLSVGDDGWLLWSPDGLRLLGDEGQNSSSVSQAAPGRFGS